MKAKYETQKGIKLYLLDSTKLKVLFETGETKLFDVKNVFNRLPHYKCLEDRKLFLKGKLDGWGGVSWTDDIDIAIETVYYEGKTVKSEENAPLLILGFKIKEERLKKELTQKELADLLGSDQADISRLEKGQFNPSIKFLNRISNVLGKKLLVTFK